MPGHTPGSVVLLDREQVDRADRLGLGGDRRIPGVGLLENCLSLLVTSLTVIEVEKCLVCIDTVGIDTEKVL